MKLLSTEITHDGRTLRQLKRTAKTAIYELRGESGLLSGYEVIRITVRKARECFGKPVTEREIYPPDSQWGRLGWSFSSGDKRAAFERFNLLVQAEDQTLDAGAAPAVLRPNSDTLAGHIRN